MKPALLVSTVGTSLFTNEAGALGAKLRSHANAREIPEPDDHELMAHVEARRARLLAATDDEAGALSAEINAIVAFRRERPDLVVHHHALVHTDTGLGRASASHVGERLRAGGASVELITADGLRSDDPAAFRRAAGELTDKLVALTRAWDGTEVRFNLTGGFKSLNGFLQALGLALGCGCFYLFETSRRLVHVPALPVRLDLAEAARAHAETLFRVAHEVPTPADALDEVPAGLLFRVGDEAELSVWGETAWSLVAAEWHRDLSGPWSPKVRYTERLRRDFADLTPRNRRQLHERVAALGKHLEDGAPMPKSATFKALQGDPVPGSTHELYLSSDGPALRVFAHYDGGTLVLDSIRSHL